MEQEQILSRLLSEISDEFDKSVGSFFYDVGKPVSEELASIRERVEEVLKNGFALTATGVYLDSKVAEQGIERKPATNSIVSVTVTGMPGSSISAGDKVASDTLVFTVTETATIDESENVTVNAVCDNYNFIEHPALFNDTHLIQIGRRHCFADEIIEKHAHIDWYELTIAIDGKGTVITNDKEESISKGDIYLSIPGDFHEIISSTDVPLKYDFISFKSKNPTIKKELRRIASDTYFCDHRIFRDETVCAAVSLAISEISSKKKYHAEILSLILEQVLFLIIRNFYKTKSEHTKKSINAADELCFQIMHYIDTHIYSITNLSDLSGVFRFNYSYLSKLFKNTTGKTISEYYQTRRLDMAKLLIIEKKLKINQIAETLNYSSLYSFSKAFKNKYGISPSHYSLICSQEHTRSDKA